MAIGETGRRLGAAVVKRIVAYPSRLRRGALRGLGSSALGRRGGRGTWSGGKAKGKVPPGLSLVFQNGLNVAAKEGSGRERNVAKGGTGVGGRDG